ncbi:MAG: T9SS type A sorting domain-containing protein [Candidatus Zixiibacteriota bacterium]|nr:MAG: T9SS type A sorting domain-containing protein [candidate division Zixibacteria bacterium]
MNTLKLCITFIFGLCTAANLKAQSIEYVESIYRAGVDDIEIVGNYAYCGIGQFLEVFDISNPILPITVDHIGLGHVPNVNIVGNYAFITSFFTGLNIIDISDPHNLALVGNNPDIESGFDVAVQGSYAFVTSYDSSLYVIDISDLSNPTIVGISQAPGFGRSIVLDGNYAYTANESFEFNIFDISNPLIPQRIGGFSNSERVFDVEVVGGTAFLAYGQAGFLVVDVSDPENPDLIGSCDTPDMALGITLSGQYAYVSNGLSGIYIINIENLSQPYIVSSYDTPYYAMRSCLCDNNLWVADFRSIQIIDVSDPINPIQIGDYRTPDPVYKTVVDNNRAYIIHKEGFHIIDVSNPYMPSRLGHYENEIPGTPSDIIVDGNYAYLAISISGMTILDITDPLNPIPLSHYMDGTYAPAIAVSGQYAYVGYDDIRVVDISDPYNPFQVGNIIPSLYVTKMAIYRDVLFTLEAYVDITNLCIYDISDPPNIQALGNYTQYFAYFTGLDFKDIYAFISSIEYYPERGWLKVIDISTPSAPNLAGSLGLSDLAYDVALTGDYGVIAAWSSGVMLIDISHPAQPLYLTEYDTYGYSVDVFVLGNLIYLSDTNAELIFRLNLTGILDDHYSLPSDFYLRPNYPNPFNSSTTIQYGLPETGRVRIDIYDLLGRKVETLVDEEKQAGRHNAAWDAPEYSSGVYFYRIEAGDFAETKRMVYLK